MALSGSITQPFQTYWQLVLEWSATQSIANNTSTITANLYLQSLGGTISSSANKTAHINIDGTTYTKNDVNINLSKDQKKLLFTATRTISHNPDGTKTFTLKGDCQINATLGGVYVGTVYIPQKSFTLDAIPRASSISSFPNFTIGTAFTVTISRHSSSFTHKLTLKAGSVVVKEVTGVGEEYTFNLTTAEQDKIYQTIPNSTSRTMTLVCQTYSGSTPVGSAVSKTAKATVPSSVVPTFDTITHSEYAEVVPPSFGKYIQGISRLSMEITGAAGARYSTISSYQIIFEGKAYNSRTAVSSVISGSGNLVITGKVTDSRGRTATKNVTVNVVPYHAPVITEFSFFRCDEDGTPNNLGTYARVTCKSYVASLIDAGGQQANLLNYKIKSKARDTSTWETKVEQTPGELSIDVAHIIGEYSPTSSYDFRLEVADVFKTALTVDVLPTATVPIAIDDIGVGIGKVRERGVMDVGGDVFADGAVDAKGDVSAGGNVYAAGVIFAAGYEAWTKDGTAVIIEQGSNDNGSYVRWSNGLQVCWRTVLYSYTELTAGEHTKTWTLPMNFVGRFFFSVNLTTAPTDATKGSVTGQRVHSRSASSADYYLSITSTFQSAASVELFAIGWWKELEES